MIWYFSISKVQQSNLNKGAHQNTNSRGEKSSLEKTQSCNSWGEKRHCSALLTWYLFDSYILEACVFGPFSCDMSKRLCMTLVKSFLSSIAFRCFTCLLRKLHKLHFTTNLKAPFFSLFLFPFVALQSCEVWDSKVAFWPSNFGVGLVLLEWSLNLFLLLPKVQFHAINKSWNLGNGSQWLYWDLWQHPCLKLHHHYCILQFHSLGMIF